MRKIKAKSKVKAIVRHCSQQKSPLTAGQPTQRNARTLTENDNRESTDSCEMDESDNEYDNDAIDLGKVVTLMTSFLHSLIQIRKTPMRGQIKHAQGEI